MAGSEREQHDDPRAGNDGRAGGIPEKIGGLPTSEKFGNSTVNIGVIRGGVAANVVPEESYAEVLMRLAGGTAEGVKSLSARRCIMSIRILM